MKEIFSILLIVFNLLPATSFAETYEVSDEQWSFDLITDTCLDQLEVAIQSINLPASAVITYPETIGHRYFSIQVSVPGSSEVSLYELEYWTEGDEQLICEHVEPMGWSE